MIDGSPWWVAKDVCSVLDHSDSAKAISRLDNDEKLLRTLLVSGQNRQTWLVNEPGLYSLILTSRKSEAKAFKRWITHEVIPTIRQTGRYAASNDPVEVAHMAQDYIARYIEAETARSKSYY